jgi:hypothetical protein
VYPKLSFSLCCVCCCLFVCLPRVYPKLSFSLCCVCCCLFVCLSSACVPKVVIVSVLSILDCPISFL